MEYNQNDIVHLAVSYLEDTAVCLSVANLADAMKQSIGRVIHYIVPMLSKSDKMKSYQWWPVEDVVFPCRKEWTKLHAWYLSCPKMTSLAEFQRLCLTTSLGHD
ncbi:hypothetical protein H5410_036962 [Solanum commersonii]|uniref:Uncharacterized protein n=1 Tax=Solanum commersonii TaxID=4109 RepID=A0A9J5Y6Q4_SOLCO|nr:hypothetical protein H5410_036962 [Solanum commersonii]